MDPKDTKQAGVSQNKDMPNKDMPNKDIKDMPNKDMGDKGTGGRDMPNKDMTNKGMSDDDRKRQQPAEANRNRDAKPTGNNPSNPGVKR